MSAATNFNAANFVTILGAGAEMPPSVCITTSKERLLFNCPEGTQRLMTQNRLKLSNKLRTMFFTQGAWSCMSGMTDVILKLSEEDQRELRMVGLKVREYTMSTCYFLGERKNLALELVPLSARTLPDAEPGRAHSLATVTTSDGTVVRPFVLVPHSDEQSGAKGAGAKRSFQEMQADEGTGAAAGVTDGAEPSAAIWQQGEDEAPSRLVLSYSPYHRAKSRLNSKRREEIASLAGRTRERLPSVCYSVVFPPLKGRFDAAMADKLGVPQGRERGMLVRGASVTLPDGTTITPEQCVSASSPGGTVLIIDCPTPAHAATLLREQVYWDLVGEPGKAGPLCVVHMSGSEVLSCADYQAWSLPFPPSSPPVPTGADAGGGKDRKKAKGGNGGPAAGAPLVVHLVCSSDMGQVDRPMFVASERYLHLLHGLDPDCFPLSQGAYKVLLGETPGRYSTNASGVVQVAGKDKAEDADAGGKQGGGGGKGGGGGDKGGGGGGKQGLPAAQEAAVVVEAAPRGDTSAPRHLQAWAGWPLMTFVLPPHRLPGLKSEVPETARLHYYCVTGCVCTQDARAAIYAQLPPPVADTEQQPPAVAGAEEAAHAAPPPPASSDNSLTVEDVVFLGTGAAAPFKYRTVSAIYLRLSSAPPPAAQSPCAHAPPQGVLLDVGDGTYGCMVRKMGAAAADAALLGLKMIFISHKHADHISGAANILARRGALLWRRRQQQEQQQEQQRAVAAAVPLQQVTAAAEETAEVWECSVCGQRFGSEASVDLHQRATHARVMRPPCRGVSDGRQAAGAVLPGDEERLLVVGPLWVDSWLRDLGALEPLSYTFVDCQDVSAASKSGARARLREQTGMWITSVAVQHSFPAYGLVLDFDRSPLAASAQRFRLVYSGDTRPCNDLVLAGMDADLLIHEATHSDDMIDKARSDRHSTVKEAVDIAARMRAKNTILTHFSSRFEKRVPDLRCYGDRAARVSCAVDGMHVALTRLAALPRLSLRMSDLLAVEYPPDGEGDAED